MDPYYRALQKAGLGLIQEEPGPRKEAEEREREPLPPEEETSRPEKAEDRPAQALLEEDGQGEAALPVERPWFEIVEEEGGEDPAARFDQAPEAVERSGLDGPDAGAGEGPPAWEAGPAPGEAEGQDWSGEGERNGEAGHKPGLAGFPARPPEAEPSSVESEPGSLHRSSRTRVAALHLTEPGGERIRELVGTSETAGLSVFESFPSDLERRALELKPDLILVEYLPDRRELEELVGRLLEALPQVPIMAWSTSRDPEDIIRAVRLGIREYLAEPTTVKAFEEAVARLASTALSCPNPTGWLTAVLGAKGGVGTTQLAINLAWAISQHHGRRVILTDYDPLCGDLAFLLDMAPEQGLTELVHNIDRLDSAFLGSVLVEVVPNLHLLPGPTDPVAAEDINVDQVRRILDLLRDRADGIVMDVSRRFDDVSLHILDRADLILVVVEPTVIGLKLARRIVDLFRKLGYGWQKVELVVNRFDAKFSLGAGDVERVLERPVAAWLPNDSGTIIEAGNAGRPVIKEAPKGPWSEAVMRMADALVERLDPRSSGQCLEKPIPAGGLARLTTLLESVSRKIPWSGQAGFWIPGGKAKRPGSMAGPSRGASGPDDAGGGGQDRPRRKAFQKQVLVPSKGS